MKVMKTLVLGLGILSVCGCGRKAYAYEKMEENYGRNESRRMHENDRYRNRQMNQRDMNQRGMYRNDTNSMNGYMSNYR